jgi:hypothetical protein
MCNTSYEVNLLFSELSLVLSVDQTESVNIDIRITEVILIISHRIAMIAPVNIFVSAVNGECCL